MDSIGIATAAVSAQQTLAMNNVQVSLLKQQQDTQSQMINMLTAATQATPPAGTGGLLNAQG